MKTNHNRGFEARPDASAHLEQVEMKAPWCQVKHPKGKKFAWSEKLELSGKQINTFIHPNGGTHSEEKCRRGAKRSMNRRARKLENAATRNLVNDIDSETK